MQESGAALWRLPANDNEIAEMEDKMAEQKSLVIDEDGEILAGKLSDSLLFEVSFLVEGNANLSVSIDVEQDDLYAAQEEEDDEGFEMIGGSPVSQTRRERASVGSHTSSTVAHASRAGKGSMASSMRPRRPMRHSLSSTIPNNYSPSASGAAILASKPTLDSSSEKVLGNVLNMQMSRPRASFGPTSNTGVSQPFGMVAGNAPTPASASRMSLSQASAFGQPSPPPPPPPAYGSVRSLSKKAMPPPAPASIPPPEYRSSTAHQSGQYYGPADDDVQSFGQVAPGLDMDQPPAGYEPMSPGYYDEEERLTTPSSLLMAPALSAQPLPSRPGCYFWKLSASTAIPQFRTKQSLWWHHGRCWHSRDCYRSCSSKGGV